MSDEYAVKCEKTNVLDIYNAIKLGGVSDGELDKGYGVVDRNDDGKIMRKPVGAGDRIISCEEILEYAVDHAGEYHALLKGLTGRDVPCVLDDFDDATDFDEGIRQRTGQVIQHIRKIVLKGGTEPGSEWSEKKMALALYYYAYLPGKEMLGYWQERMPRHLESITTPLEIYGLKEFKTWLTENGGLGFMTMEADLRLEGSALDLFKENKGFCTEKAKVFYAMLKMAGLSPRIDVMSGKDVTAMWSSFFGDKNILRLGPGETFTGHIVVALDIGDETWHFEFQGMGPVFDLPFEDIATPLTLREFYQLENLNLSLDYQDVGNRVKANEAWWGAYQLGTSLVSPSVFSNAASLIYRRDKSPAALQSARSNAEDALSMDPRSEFSRHILCKVLTALKQFDDAIGCFQEASDSSPLAPFDLGQAYYQAGRFKEAREHLLKSARVSIASAFSNHLIGLTYMLEGKDELALEYFLRTLDESPFTTACIGNAVDVLEKEGRLDEAIKYVRKMIAVAPLYQDPYGRMTRLLVSGNRMKEAAAYFKQYLSVIEGNILEANSRHLMPLLDLVREMKKKDIQGDIGPAVKTLNDHVDTFPSVLIMSSDPGAILTELYIIFTDIALRKNDRKTALECIHRAREINPSHEEVQRRMKSLGIVE